MCRCICLNASEQHYSSNSVSNTPSAGGWQRNILYFVKVFDSPSRVTQSGFIFLLYKTSKPFMSAHMMQGMYMAPPQGPLCDPVGTSATLSEALHSFTNHTLGWGSLLKLMNWLFTSWFELLIINKWCDFSNDHKRYTGYVWTLNTRFM